MFTDIVGYTSLTQRDEAGAIELLSEHNRLLRPIFHTFGGREVKTMGDAFLVEFPSALNAVRCAARIQESLHDRNSGLPSASRIELRIGIHLGEVIIEGQDILGDAVNVSSRLRPLAGPGEVCVSGQVYEQVSRKVDIPFVKLPRPVLKNVEAPVDVYRLVLKWERDVPQGRNEMDRHRIGVLPLRSMSADPNDEYFAEGMTEELISSISRVPGLSVISRTSMMGYKNKDKAAGEIGRELRAGTLVEGSVRKAGNRVRITVQLIEAESDGHLWAENYDRNLEDIFAVQSEIAEKVASSLQIRLLAEDRNRIEKQGTKSAKAFTLYLKGRVHVVRWDKNSLFAAIKYFEEAIAEDPDYAAAYASLAGAYRKLGFTEIIPTREAYENGERYARRALELDESLPEAHLAVALTGLYDLAKRIRALKRAIELDPNLTLAHIALASSYAFTRQWEECLTEVGLALELDPVSVETLGSAGTWYMYAKQYDKAERYLRDALEVDPGNTFALNNLGLVHIQQGKLQEGLDEVRKVSGTYGAGYQSDLGYALVRAGRVEEARQILNELLQSRAGGGHTPSTAIAGIYASLGEKDKALEWLEKLYEEKSGYLEAVNADFVFDGLRKEPRFQDLMKKMGI